MEGRMDGWLNRWKARLMDCWLDGRMPNQWLDRCTVAQGMEKGLIGWMHVSSEGKTCGGVDECMDGRTDERING